MAYNRFPKNQGLYDAQFEKDSCGVGFVCDIKGIKSHKTLRKGIDALKRLEHRGAVGADPLTGDGAGILIQIPHKFFKKESANFKIDLPAPGEYAAGLIFFPPDKKEREFCKDVFKKVISEEGQILLGYRSVPVDNSYIGEGAKKTEPVIEHIFIKKNSTLKSGLDFERKLYLIRKETENIVRNSGLKQKAYFYITNISSRVISYKGLLMSSQLDKYFVDLNDKDLETSICLIHARYSTNTFPTWDLAQPFRMLAHNGEINTLRGNINWMHARESLLECPLFGEDIEKIKPVIIPGGSDSATIDNVFELLVLAGRSLSSAMMMLIPAAWENDNLMDKKLRDFYEFHTCFSEPWDGPASIAFTDGISVGAVLDRNGLRPARYIVTKDNFAVMASEVGVLDIEPSNISISGRLEPGKMFFINTQEQRIIDDYEIKKKVSQKAPYSEWIKKNLIEISSLKIESKAKNKKHGDLNTLMDSFGYTREDLKMIIKPMVENSKEPIGSMGSDTPHAVLSKRPYLLYDYFKQLFAQVTNPAIDSIREKVVMSLNTYLGPQKNILDESPEHCHKLKIDNPVITNEILDKLKDIDIYGFRTKTISLLFDITDEDNLVKRLDEICKEAEDSIKEKFTFIILSDRGTSKDLAAIPALLAVGAVHHHLIRKELRTQIGIIIESAEPREVHHFAVLFGYGADCINPYLAYEAINSLIEDREINLTFKEAQNNYINALKRGILKIIAKMGISTIQSYRGAQIFEALGIHDEVIKRCFTGTASRIGGITFRTLARETIMRHKNAYDKKIIGFPYLNTGGIYQWKKDGEFHLWNPQTIATLQDAARKSDYSKYKEFAEMINNQKKNPTTLRGLLKFKKHNSIPIEEVEPVEEIVKRFVTGAMSFGSISRGAHETLAIAMNRLGGKSNTGEGGEDPVRFHPLPNGDSLRSATKQVASGRFGVTTNYLVNSDEIQIKIAQGAKPGEGGQLPGRKVSVTIARTRYTTPGVTLISPPPHHDIYSIEDLAQLIFDLKNANPKARISVKLVSEIGVGTIAAGVAKGHADMILISGADGGTGASPRSSIRHAGLPWELGLSETHQTLVLNDLRSRVRLQTDGQMRTGRDVAIAAILGAEEYGFCTAALITMGCVMLRHCNLNNCSVGIATQDERLQHRFRGKPEYVVNYFYFVAQELREIMASLGVRKIEELIGKTDFLELNKDILPWKAHEIDFSRILYKPDLPKSVGRYCIISQDHGIDKIMDLKLIDMAKNSLEKKEPFKNELPIRNVDRTTGAMLSSEVCRRYGEEALPEDTIHFKFRGAAGQSFGAFLAKGITFELEGMANDYVGKGISGGKVIIYPYKDSTYNPCDNIIIGNTCFYGAISGEAYIRGVAGERFCIRNSGLNAVVEGVGDHGCEYMTGGRVVILGKTGRNFAAGMSGGIAYIYDIYGNFNYKCNLEMVELEKPDSDDIHTIHNLIRSHYQYTKSKVTEAILGNFSVESKRFIKVMPLEYKHILEGKVEEEELETAEYSEG